MSLKTLVNDSTRSTMRLIGQSEIAQRIEWDEIFNHKLAVENVFDARGNVIPERQNIVDPQGNSLSIMQGRFALTQPAEFRDILQTALDGVEHEICFAASYNGLRNYVIGVEFPGLSDFDAGRDGDKQKYIHLARFAVDGSWSLALAGMIHRFYCANQFPSAFKNAEGSAKNTANGQTRFVSIVNQMEAIERSILNYKVKCEQLANQPATELEAERFIAGLIAPNDTKLAAPTVRMIEDTTERFSRGMGNIGQSRYDIFNAITERYTHEAGRANARIGNSIAGTASTMKRNAFQLVSDEQGFRNTVARGQHILALAS